MNSVNVLSSSEDFQNYLDSITIKLADRARDRHLFLVRAIHQIEERIAIAHDLEIEDVAKELHELLAEARMSLERLERFNGQREIPEMELPKMAVEPEIVIEQGLAIANELKEAESRNEEVNSAVEKVEEATPVLKPAMAAEIHETEVFEEAPARDLREILANLDELEQADSEIVARSNEDWPALCREKAVLCRLRSLQRELEYQNRDLFQLYEVRRKIKDKIYSQFGEFHYIIPLDPKHSKLDIHEWNRLADLYEGLAVAWELFNNLQESSDPYTDNELHKLLEVVAARQSLMHRFIMASLGEKAFDLSQRLLYEQLKNMVSEHDIFLSCLSNEYSNEELEARIATQETIEQRHQNRIDKDQTKEKALRDLEAMLTWPDFGTYKSDSNDLCEKVITCRNAGIPASNKKLGDLVADWRALLADSDDRHIKELLRELDRREEKASAHHAAPVEAEESSTNGAIDPAILQSVLKVTQNKKCLIIGGQKREENRAELQRVLELADLDWPSTKGNESFREFEDGIQHADFVILLIRFIRTGWKRVSDICERSGSKLIRVPGGYGVSQIVHQLYSQVCVEGRPDHRPA
ncbi:MAG: hypothetical protein M1330_01405 [Armatimonadetes bacterium]|nr:hypothetical protein [Armatimonadota bacterium]